MLFALALAAQIAPVLATPDARDVHSHAEPLVARVTHVSLDLAADFTTKVVRGTATLDIRAKPDARTIVLDDNGLRIAAITDARGKPLAYTVGPRDAVHGSALTVTIGAARRIRIAYATAPDAKALQWLEPEQTAGKAQPYLFSQGQAILNRSWVPTQDSPGIRQTWDAKVAVPCALTVVMSGDKTAETPCAGGRRTFAFRMTKPVAPYLIALAVGDLTFRSLGPRTGIWAEPVTLGKAAYEFGELEQFVSAAESLYGAYRWGRYDVLVLPPSFRSGAWRTQRSPSPRRPRSRGTAAWSG